MPNEGERAPELLRVDGEQLDRAAELLRGDEPALVLVVCGKALIPAALEYLREQANVIIPETVVLQGAEEALGTLMGATPESAGAKVRSLALGGDAKEALRALNWHREKLLRGAPVVMWLDGMDGLTEMREVAPDAYSFRDIVVLVRGDGGRLPHIPQKGSQSILEARRRLARAKSALERANAYERLAHELRIHNYLVESETVARRGLEILPENKYSEENARIARARSWNDRISRAKLWLEIALAVRKRGLRTRQRDAALRGLDEIQGITTEKVADVLSLLLVAVPGPIGPCDLLRVEQAFSLARDFRLAPNVNMQVMRAMSAMAFAIGDVDRAHKILYEIDARGASPDAIRDLRVDQGQYMWGAGRMLDAESYFQQAISLGKEGGVLGATLVNSIVKCWVDRGELRAAEQVGHEFSLRSDMAYMIRPHVIAMALGKGEFPVALEHVRGLISCSAQLGADGECLDACELLARIATEGADARQFDADALKRIAVELEVAEDVSRSIAGNEQPPWYLIRLLSFRAGVLIRTERGSEALDLARRALDLARTTCVDLIPKCGRALADHLLRACKPEDALPILVEIEPEAVERSMLKELARIRAARVLALVLLNQSLGVIEDAMTALREALESTGAPRIKAETLLELATRLPPATTLPDPLVLASESHALFVEMPMPAKEARSLELAGDVLSARGKSAEAKRRYLVAQGILERRGLRLRLQLLETKIKQLS